MNKKYIKTISITFILTIGMLGAVSGFSETDSTKTNIESKKCSHKDEEKCKKQAAEKCDHKDAEKCKKHDSEKCDKANKADHKSGSCCKNKGADSKSSQKKSENKCTRSVEDSTKTI